MPQINKRHYMALCSNDEHSTIEPGRNFHADLFETYGRRGAGSRNGCQHWMGQKRITHGYQGPNKDGGVQVRIRQSYVIDFII